MATDNKINFTKTALEKLQPPKAGRACYHDLKLPGLVLYITPADSRTFYLYRWQEGKPVRVRLGTFPSMSVEQARTEARDKLSDPQAVQAARRAQREEPTVATLWEHWETTAKPRKRSWGEDERRYLAHLKPWANRKLSTITKAMVQRLHADLGTNNGPYEANRVLALLKTMLNTAGDVGYDGANPAASVKKFPEHSRDRFLQAEELKAFFTALSAETETWQTVFALALLTGARKSNVLAMRWADVDLQRGLWLISSSSAKAGKALCVPLTPQAVAVLASHRERSPASEWVFPGVGKTGHLKEPKGAWRRIMKSAGLSDLRMHDLRRSLGSWMAIGGTSLPIVGKALGHTTPSATAVYARLSVDPVKDAMMTAGDAMLAAGGVQVLTVAVKEGDKR